jgi:putative ABC transport system ATP-binding protein
MIVLKNVNRVFNQNSDKNFEALKEINLEIQEGEALLLKGMSGSGKSTLLSIIGAILKPSSGLVVVDGFNISSLSDYHLSKYRNETIGFITQSFHLFEELSVRDNLLPPLLINNYSLDEIESRTTTAMQLSNISHKAQQRVSNLSGGEKQRCMIARSIVNSPKIILCDEPTANLDRENSLKFVEILRKLKIMGKTILIATHDPLFEELEVMDRVINIKEGQIE